MKRKFSFGTKLVTNEDLEEVRLHVAYDRSFSRTRKTATTRRTIRIIADSAYRYGLESGVKR